LLWVTNLFINIPLLLLRLKAKGLSLIVTIEIYF
jgi:hypothetical protein